MTELPSSVDGPLVSALAAAVADNTSTAIESALNGIAMGIVPWFTRLAGRAQSGYLFHYAFAMVLGLVILTLWLGLGSAG